MTSSKRTERRGGSLPFRLARTLYRRWLELAPSDRQRTQELADDARERAFELRGAPHRPAAERELLAANKSLAAAIVESVEADPEVDETEVQQLREDLRRELDRLAHAEISASATGSTAIEGRKSG